MDMLSLCNSKECLGANHSPAQSGCWCLLNQSLTTGFGRSRLWAVFSFFPVPRLCSLLPLVWKVVARLCHIVLPGAVPGEQHSLLSSLSAPLMRVPASLPFMSAAFSSPPSPSLGHLFWVTFFLGTNSTAGFSRLVAFLTLEGCFVLICFVGQNTKG